MLKFILLPLVVAAVMVFEGTAQDVGTIMGTVIDRDASMGVPGANLHLDQLQRGAAANDRGEFLIERVPAGQQMLVVSAIGYKTLRRTLTVVARDTVRLTVLLSADVLRFDEVTTMGQRSYSAASSEFMRALDFELRPKQSAQDMLRMVPGLVTAQHAGGGKAEQIFLRGFDADHGTDINIAVDGVPVNMVSHGHGQGYADLHFVIPEVIEGLEVFKGPYSAVFGDLATAGSVRLKTRDELDHNFVRLEGATFQTYRSVGALQLPIESNATRAYLAAEAYHSGGYFDVPIDLNRYNGFAKLVSHLDGQTKLSVWMSGFSSRWNATGQIPERAVQQGLISRFGSIDPSEGGHTDRYNIYASYQHIPSEGPTLLVQTFASRYDFQLFSNFTFFARDSVHGDGIEQSDSRWVYGGAAELTYSHRLGERPSVVTAGAAYRADAIDVQLYRQQHRRRIETAADAMIHQHNLSAYVQEDVHLSEIVKIQLGLRGDVFFFDVNDRLTDSVHVPVAGFVQKAVISPKANIVLSPNRRLDVFVNFGGGFHSNDARAVVAGKAERTIPRAWGAELGFRMRPFDALELGAAMWALDLENEWVYVGDEGTTEINGPTRRLGVDLEARARITEWLYADADIALARGRFRLLPAGDDFIPLAPTFTATGGLTVRHPSGIEATLRLRHVSSRPASEDNSVTARGYSIADASLAYRFWNLKVQLTGENLLNTDWNEAQFDTESRLRGEPAPVSELHFTPGAPFNLKLGLEYRF
jgi:outer membrane receptor protein involved in Fe transport